MARGPLAAGGALYYADLVAEALGRAGADIADARRGLDFGCSSGRLVRALGAAWPETEWHGCDPNARRDRVGARAPARHRLRALAARAAAALRRRRVRRRLRDLDLVALRRAARRSAWLAEMHRVIRPGGRLVLTAHGMQSVAHYARTGAARGGRARPRARRALPHGLLLPRRVRRGGDWGVRHPQWGTSFFTPEWLLARAVPGLGGRGLRGRPQRRQPGRLRPAAPLSRAHV